MVLQAERQIDYLQRTLSIFLRNANDMREQFETLMDELINESKQQLNNKSPKQSPESSSSDSKSDALTNGNSPQPLTQKKRSATSAANSKPPPTKRLKSEPTTSAKDDEEDEKKNSSDDETNDDDDDDQDETKSKTIESQSTTNPTSTRDINEFAIEIGLVCNKCMVLTEEKDNRLVECHECHLRYHQRCHKPPVSTADIRDPRWLWYCAKCRRSITKRQQSQSTIKEIKSNSNSSSSSTPSSSNLSTNKTKAPESILSSVKKGLTPSITDVTTGLFTLKAKSSDSLISDNNTSHSANPLNSSNSSTTNNGMTTTTTTTKNTNGWASLVTGSKEKKSTTTTTTESSSSIFNDLTSGTTNEPKAAPSSPKSSFNSLNKTSFNGGNLSLLKATSSTVLSTIKPTKPSSPPVLKTQLSSSTLKSSTKVLPTGKSIQRISSPTPLGRQTSTIKSPPPPPPTPPSTTNNNSRSNSSPSSTTTNSNHLKIPSGLDCEKRLKKIRKLAAEKTLTKKY